MVGGPSPQQRRDRLRADARFLPSGVRPAARARRMSAFRASRRIPPFQPRYIAPVNAHFLRAYCQSEVNRLPYPCPWGGSRVGVSPFLNGGGPSAPRRSLALLDRLCLPHQITRVPRADAASRRALTAFASAPDIRGSAGKPACLPDPRWLRRAARPDLFWCCPGCPDPVEGQGPPPFKRATTRRGA